MRFQVDDQPAYPGSVVACPQATRFTGRFQELLTARHSTDLCTGFGNSVSDDPKECLVDVQAKTRKFTRRDVSEDTQVQ